jgi:hypothetical protein
MNFLLIFPHYISWHYTKAISDLLILSKNFIWFFWNLFSINILLKTLFVPFQKLSVQSTKRFDLEDFFSALATNLLMRLVGFVIRSFFVIFGLLTLVFVIIFFFILFIVWILLPLILLSMFVLGLVALINFKNV